MLKLGNKPLARIGLLPSLRQSRKPGETGFPMFSCATVSSRHWQEVSLPFSASKALTEFRRSDFQIRIARLAATCTLCLGKGATPNRTHQRTVQQLPPLSGSGLPPGTGGKVRRRNRRPWPVSVGRHPAVLPAGESSLPALGSGSESALLVKFIGLGIVFFGPPFITQSRFGISPVAVGDRKVRVARNGPVIVRYGTLGVA